MSTLPSRSVAIRFTSHQESDVEVVVTEVASERPSIPRFKFSVNHQREPHETPLPETMKHVVRVVSIEGPIHESESCLPAAKPRRSALQTWRAGLSAAERVDHAIFDDDVKVRYPPKTGVPGTGRPRGRSHPGDRPSRGGLIRTTEGRRP